MFTEDLLRLLAPSRQVRHRRLRRPIRQVFVDHNRLVHGKFASELVRESFELAESDPKVIDAVSFHSLNSHLTTVYVVAGNNAPTVRLNVINNVVHHVVIASVGIFDTVPYWRLVVVFLCQGSFFVHVSSSNKLNSEVVAQNLGGKNFISNDLFHSLQVALKSVHNYSFVSYVEFVGKLLAEGLNSSLHEGLLSVNVKHTVFIAGVLGDVCGLLRECLKYLQVLL